METQTYPGRAGLARERRHPNPALAGALRRELRGEVRFDAGSRALYSTDASNYRQVPIGVVVPRDQDDVVAAVAICHEHEVPVLPRGAGTSLAGQACNVALVLDFTKHLNRILEIDPQARLARVQPGVVLDDLRAAARVHGLSFGPDPATHDRCTLGGMIGNDSCGVHSIMAGRTAHNVLGLSVLTYDGLRLDLGPTPATQIEAYRTAGDRRAEIYGRLRDLGERYRRQVQERFPAIPRRVSGYALEALLPEHELDLARALVGSEGTCVTLLEASLRLVPDPPCRILVLFGFPDIATAAESVPELMAPGRRPVGLEGLDRGVVDLARARGLGLPGLSLFPAGTAWLLAEYGAASPAAALAQAQFALDSLSSAVTAARVIDTVEAQAAVWAVREAGLGVTAIGADGRRYWSGWEDAAVAPERLGAYLRDFLALRDHYGYRGHLFGHFGDGCVHTHLDFDLRSASGLARFRAFLGEAADLVVSHGGSLSGEHGDGQARGALLERMYGPELMAGFREFKAIWDPRGRMNPGKLIDARPPDADLRLGPAYDPPPVGTQFHYPEDGGDFRATVTRCMGVGACRRAAGGAMCPSFRATGEEAHSTRGRARLLFEMLQGELITDGWASPEVKEALDLCLSCKACQAECPLGVDMAAYKAEFLSRYFEGRRRPRAAYTLARVDRWAHMGGAHPALARLANTALQAPGLAALAKWAAGVHPARHLPALAPEPFTRRFARDPAPAALDRPRVLLWPDTVNNYLRPATCDAGQRVLEAAGFRVEIPGTALCCGRPLYDFGLLEAAKRALEDILADLAEPIAAGVPLVGLEPSCASVFRDELLRLFPGREDARRLASQSFLLPDFLVHHAPRFQPPTLGGQALLHGHCHHKALVGLDDELAILAGLGLSVTLPESSCCGMAGAFGFRREHYEVSMTLAERALLPAARAAAPEALLIADGFSCREQIEQGSGRATLHLAEVLDMALHGAESQL